MLKSLAKEGVMQKFIKLMLLSLLVLALVLTIAPSIYAKKVLKLGNVQPPTMEDTSPR